VVGQIQSKYLKIVFGKLAGKCVPVITLPEQAVKNYKWLTLAESAGE
jgi:hypothetical protein